MPLDWLQLTPEEQVARLREAGLDCWVGNGGAIHYGPDYQAVMSELLETGYVSADGEFVIPAVDGSFRSEYPSEPPEVPGLVATFKLEEEQDGEDVGPLIVSDPVTSNVVWKSPDWVYLSDARQLATEKGWLFDVDG